MASLVSLNRDLSARCNPIILECFRDCPFRGFAGRRLIVRGSGKLGERIEQIGLFKTRDYGKRRGSACFEPNLIYSKHIYTPTSWSKRIRI
ncbi:hypothetical protein L596_007952 [Steinernema carpocapsae]|uniref:Uncharacterized protein n=1 Tax=Steinernema carpocapsae TaxID=34508 RepID=A0A4U5PBH5_STECR|nr:hypothetical protein L596_007952 [Steinernema carpocapsae]